MWGGGPNEVWGGERNSMVHVPLYNIHVERRWVYQEKEIAQHNRGQLHSNDLLEGEREGGKDVGGRGRGTSYLLWLVSRVYPLFPRRGGWSANDLQCRGGFQDFCYYFFFYIRFEIRHRRTEVVPFLLGFHLKRSWKSKRVTVHRRTQVPVQKKIQRRLHNCGNTTEATTLLPTMYQRRRKKTVELWTGTCLAAFLKRGFCEKYENTSKKANNWQQG